MNKYFSTVLLYFLLSIVSINTAESNGSQQGSANGVVSAVMNQLNKVSKKPDHKSPLEFKHAVGRYIAYTNTNCLSAAKVGVGKMSSYEIELRYLFNNAGKFSTTTLLSRVRSAHQELIKHNGITQNAHGERYEQICSALLLQCAHMLFENARKQLLDALHYVDDLIIYWQYQKDHPLSYCFGKSPLKWISGKRQEQEISDNIKKLQRKQAGLYTILGRLTAHAHCFTECNLTYTDCYTWIEQLFLVLKCIKTGPQKVYDNSRFDKIAARLESKIKVVSSLKYYSLQSLAGVKKSNHCVRNWIAYTAALAAAGFATHYYIHNQAVVNKFTLDSSSSMYANWQDLVVKPSRDIVDTVFGEVNSSIVDSSPEGQNKKTVGESVKEVQGIIKDLEEHERCDKATSNNLKKYLAKDHATTRTHMRALLEKHVDKLRISPTIAYQGFDGDSYIFTQEHVEKIMAAEEAGNVSLFQNFFYAVPRSFLRNDDFIDAIIIIAELKIYHYGSSLISIVFELVVDYGIPVIKDVLEVLAKGNKEWAAAYKKVNLILNVAVLTPTIIVGWAGYSGLSKTYRWATKKNYSPIRIALADVNSLLIESSMPLDDYDYGKLVYLVHKLRNKASSLKNVLGNEFLADVTKLESKQFSVKAKRGIVDNMFNKYSFLGRIVV